jgi:hypothetical protein
MRRLASTTLTLATLAAPLALGGTAAASERHFTSTQESAVLAPGARELEVWSTWRRGREQFYSRFDERLELEIGVTDRLMTAFYLNFSSVSKDSGVDADGDGHNDIATEAAVEGVSWELKYKFSDAVADPLGFAVYGEVGLGSDEAEFELKLIADKRIDAVLVAANLVYEPEVEFEGHENEVEHNLEVTAGASWFLAPRFAVGLEARSHTIIEEGEVEHSALFAGPVAFYGADHFWVALTTLFQVKATTGATPGYTVDMADHERFNARLLFGTDF